jgi:AraC-like DNA-binding protein
LRAAANSYASANYLNAAAGGELDTWLITPEFSTGINGALASFWLRADAFAATGDQVASVALEAGYESEAAFARAFKRETGTSPARWRRMQHAG